MLVAIGGAERSIRPASYTFGGEGVGRDFVRTLARARSRVIAVWVLIDDFDVRFTVGVAVHALRTAGVTVGVFNPPLLPALERDPHPGLPLDPRRRRHHRVHRRPQHRCALLAAGVDLHARLRVLIAAQFGEVFAKDWHFATGESLRGGAWRST
ncbi:MAG: hypothetical protein FJ381_07070 [Verrucomicrobia bacterium]|nr:hypothetical protein [Verrucomicrobiota bacterium]